MDGNLLSLRDIRFTGTAPVDVYNREEALLDALSELPSDQQTGHLVANLRVSTLRRITTELLQHNISVARNPHQYPYDFVMRLGSLIATAQEAAASRRGITKVLRDREEMKSSDTA